MEAIFLDMRLLLEGPTLATVATIDSNVLLGAGKENGAATGLRTCGLHRILACMNQVTQLLNAIAAGRPQAADELLPLVYDELRRLAAQKMAQEPPGHTLDATALVHEAYLRVVGDERRGSSPPNVAQFANRRHFFAAAAEAMRRILVESARRRHALKRGGAQVRHELEEIELAVPEPREDLLALDEALEKLAAADKQAAEIVHLRYFAGFTLLEAAEVLGVSPRTAHRLWAYARAFLHREITT
jgi:RNA polymerase sigma factor (TIGR02999 family)